MKSKAMFQRLWNWNVAAVLALTALSWPALWAVWLRPPRSQPRRPRTAAPVIKYILSDPAKGSGLWSPLLFSLPTPYGFSRIVQMEWLETRDFTAVPPPQPPFLQDRTETQALPATAGDLQTAIPVIRKNLSRYRPAPAQSAAPPPVIVAGKPTWKAGANLSEIGFALPPAWTGELPAVPRPWSVTALVDIDEHGLVRRVFLTGPHDNAVLNAFAISLLRRSRAAARGRPTSGTVTVYAL